MQITKAAKEINWVHLSVELIILILGFTVSLQVNEWENRRNDRELETEYLERLQADFDRSGEALRKDIGHLSTSIDTLSAGINVLGKPVLSAADHQKLFAAAGASALVGGFGVTLGTLDELKDTGNMRLLRSKELRVALGNLYQSYQQTLRITQMRNLLRSQSFPVLAQQLMPNDQNEILWDSEHAESNKREIYVALTVIQHNQALDLSDSEALAQYVEKINAILASEL